ncbi:DUF1637 domain-containing protein [Anaerosphaera multitolerans]|uniref:DUF1637 domain-containing protein n=1 Tax=Anaerosphaera multitolerans TaxID=2487351 RepID=A0A437S5A0_9FIRM|nr:DUF1637 domain-containing protein [Anaerosphaera multitolerans]RVU54189.1 DUF1637 domain-containing protein [Anaerosphaera multitolerans]
MVGKIKSGVGIIFDKTNYKVVRKSGVKGDVIPTHNHEGKEIVFIVMQGSAEVILNEEEKYNLNKFDVLNFDGVNTMSVKFIVDSEIVIILVKK